MQHVTQATGKAALGGSGAIAAVTNPSEYISYFDRVYDLGVFQISGDDISRTVGVIVGVLVGSNIIYNIIKDLRKRKNDRIRFKDE